MNHCLCQHGTGVLVCGQIAGMRLEDLAEQVLLGGRSVAEDPLHHEVAVLMPDKLKPLLQQEIHHSHRLLMSEMLQESLHDPASIAVACQLRSCPPPLGSDLLDDELTITWPEQGDEPLKDVVPEGAAGCFPDMSSHLLCKCISLLVGDAGIDGFLHTTASGLLLAKLPDTALDVGCSLQSRRQISQKDRSHRSLRQSTGRP
mmetsp:Transcript_7630/g.16164  ORF Transcript_7630/g.16164 Transcript_7630/m.16164 type:complete len:202 (-) Transcript_7630:400-1005(-)